MASALLNEIATVPRRRLLIVVTTGAILLWFIVRNAGLLFLTDVPSQSALLLPPASPQALIAKIRRQGLSVTRPPTPAMMGQFEGVLRHAPLAAEPFFAAAMRSRAEARFPTAMAQMLEASRRDPRVWPAHVFLVEQYIRFGQLDQAVRRIAIALRLPLPDAAVGRLMQALYLMAGDARGRLALNAALGANPPWRGAFVQYVASRGGDANVLFAALQAPPVKSETQVKLEEQRSFLEGLIAKHDYERAYLAWLNFLPADALTQVTPIYDGTFRRLPGPPPFNWQLSVGNEVTVEMSDGSRIRPGTALMVNFFGSTRTTIASQLLFVPPGNYTLSATALGNSQSELGGYFRWELSCLPAGPAVAQIDFTKLGDAPVKRSAAVQIMPGCTAQSLTLLGMPGETNAQVNAEFGALSLSPR